MADEIKAWQNFLRTKRILKLPGRFGISKNEAFASVSFGGRSIDHTSDSKSKRNLSEKSLKRSGHLECICGKHHDIAYCNCLNSNRSYPSWLKLNSEVKPRIKKYCKYNPKFYLNIEQEVERWKAQRKLKEGISENIAAINDFKFEKNWENIEEASLVGSGSSCLLFDSVMLSSGTNVHVVKMLIRYRFIS